GPVPQGELTGLALREGLVLDAEEPLEAPEPHLQLEELVGLSRLYDAVHPLSHLAPQEVRAQLPFGAGQLAGGHSLGLYASPTTGVPQRRHGATGITESMRDRISALSREPRHRPAVGPLTLPSVLR